VSFTLTRAQVRELDRRALDEYGLPGLVLMENAGRGCAELLMRLNPEKQPTLILCGPGNNGGDGFVMARHLDNAGWPVLVQAFAEDAGLAADAGIHWEVLRQSDLPVGCCHPANFLEGSRFLPFLMTFDTVGWVVDALFGTGLGRPLADPFTQLTALLQAAGKPVLAIDIPSGLDCDTGEPLGPTVRATHTATFVAPKRGFINPKSREWTGEVHVIDIGAPRKLVDEYRS
jgi:NAD(P)H-hydrate epimerase